MEFQVKELKENLEKETRAKVDAIRVKKLAEDQAMEYEAELDEAKMVMRIQKLLSYEIDLNLP